MRREKWERAVPAYGLKVLTPTFYALAAISALGLALSGYRELAGLGPVSGMSDAFGWGIWKTFNVMVLTGLGSGALVLGTVVWIFNYQKQHHLMRVALLTSFLAYATGLGMLGVDAARPWNFYWVFFPWNWNLHSPLAEVAVCMTAYATLPLFLENLPAIYERYWYLAPKYRKWIEKAQVVEHYTFPFVVSLAYILPMMHQSSLGALMLLAGEKVHVLWQSPLTPLLYVWAAGWMGYAFVGAVTLFCSLSWKRPVDLEVMQEASKLISRILGVWLIVRVIDILVRGKILTIFTQPRFGLIFLLEMVPLTIACWWLYKLAQDVEANGGFKKMFDAFVIIGLAGMLYRFSPTTLAYVPNATSFYFPALIEVIISLAFITLGAIAFLVAVKKLAILPAPNRLWYEMAERAKRKNPDLQLVEHEPADVRAHAVVAGD